MKKFLTVLLALSVVFTYTFGTAFAVTPTPVKTYTLSEVETAIYAQAQANVKQLDAVKANFLANYSTTPVTVQGVVLSKAAVEKVIDNIFRDIAGEINKVADAQKTAAYNATKVGHVPAKDAVYTPVSVKNQTQYAAALDTSAEVSKVIYTVKADGTQGAASTSFTQTPVDYYVYEDIKATDNVYDAGRKYESKALFDSAKASAKNGKMFTKSGSTYEEVTGEWSNADVMYYQLTAVSGETLKQDYVKETCSSVTDFNAAKAKSAETTLKNIYTLKDGKYVVAKEFLEVQQNFIVCTALKVDGSGFPGYFTEDQKNTYAEVVNTEYLKYDTALDIQGYITNTATKYHSDMLVAEHAAQKAEVVALFNKVDLTKFSNEIPSTADTKSAYYLTANTNPNLDYYFLASEGYYSYQARIKSVLAEANRVLALQDLLATDDTDAEKAKKIKAIADETAFFATYKTLIETVPTILGEKWDKEDLDNAQSRLVASLKVYLSNEKAAQYDAAATIVRQLERLEAYGTTLTTAQKQQLKDNKDILANLDSEFAALEEVYTAQVKNSDDVRFDTVKNIQAFVKANDWRQFPTTTGAKALSSAKIVKVTALKADAANYVLMTGIDGKPMYDKDAVAKALEAATKTVYLATTTSAVDAVKLNVSANYDVVKAEMAKVLLGSAKVEFDKKMYSTVEKWNVTTEYDTANAKLAKAARDEAKTAIRAAKTVADVDAAFLTAYAKYDAVLTLADRDAAQIERAYQDKIAEYTKEISILVDNKIARYVGTLANDYSIGSNLDTYKAKLVGAANTDNGLYAAYSVEDMKAKYDAITATVNGLKSNKELDIAVKAINDAIAAVKLPVVIENKATILDLNTKVEAITDYVKDAGLTYALTGLRTSLLTSLTADLATLDAKEIKDAVALIVKDGAINLDEEAAIDKVVALVDTYEDNYGAAAKTALLNNADVKKVYDADLTPQKINAVVAMIAKIDATAPTVDVAAVKAARAAYDALAENGNASALKEMYAKLLALENLVSEQEVAAVTGLKITTSSSAKKGAITVKWRTQTKNVKVDGYQVYKSTKKFSAYKKAFTTTKMTYKNTKQLKKGTTYYYKVRAYKVLDGKKVYSDWSNKAVRVAK